MTRVTAAQDVAMARTVNETLAAHVSTELARLAEEIVAEREALLRPRWAWRLFGAGR